MLIAEPTKAPKMIPDRLSSCHPGADDLAGVNLNAGNKSPVPCLALPHHISFPRRWVLPGGSKATPRRESRCAGSPMADKSRRPARAAIGCTADAPGHALPCYRELLDSTRWLTRPEEPSSQPLRLAQFLFELLHTFFDGHSRNGKVVVIRPWSTRLAMPRSLSKKRVHTVQGQPPVVRGWNSQNRNW